MVSTATRQAWKRSRKRIGRLGSDYFSLTSAIGILIGDKLKPD